MATYRVYWRGTKQEAMERAREFARLLAAKSVSGGEDIVRDVNLAVGVAALGDIKRDFVTKARGGTGEDGVKWAPLQPATVAARRLGKGEKARLKKKGIKRSQRTDIEILRDTGILLNSLSPGIGGSNQILQPTANGVIVGTNVPYASVHQHGSKKRNIPARPFLPERVPDSWKQGWLRVASAAAAIAIKRFFERAN